MSKRTHIYTSNETCARLAIAVHMDDFRMYGELDDPVKDSLRDIADRYRANSRSSFLLNGRILLDACVLWDTLSHLGRSEGSKVHMLVSDIIRELGRGEPTFVSPPLEFGPEDRLFDELVSDYSAVPDISSQCRKLGIDKFSINERFSRAYGRTPYALHKYFRMLGASKMIVHGEEDMSKVAQSFGYTKESKFAAAFKKEFGIRPKHFREEYWGRLGKGLGQ